MAVKLLLIISIIFVVIGGALLGGYLIIDKVVVPKHLSSYGIHDMSELVTMLKTIYNSPKESEFIKNQYTEADKTSSINTLKNANFPVNEATGSIDYNYIAKNNIEVKSATGELEFTDREIASILDDILKSGVLVANLEEIESLDTLTMDTKEVIIIPKEENGITDTNSANISFTILVNTKKVRNEMAKKMDVPLFLLNMIVPEDLYFTCQFDISKKIDEKGNVIYNYANTNMSINGTTAEQSEILINLLIDFIFDESHNMTKDKLIEELGGIVIYGLELIGDFEFASGIGPKNNQNGLRIILPKI